MPERSGINRVLSFRCDYLQKDRVQHIEWIPAPEAYKRSGEWQYCHPDETMGKHILLRKAYYGRSSHIPLMPGGKDQLTRFLRFWGSRQRSAGKSIYFAFFPSIPIFISAKELIMRIIPLFPKKSKFRCYGAFKTKIERTPEKFRIFEVRISAKKTFFCKIIYGEVSQIGIFACHSSDG